MTTGQRRGGEKMDDTNKKCIMLPCPFCGGPADVDCGDDDIYVPYCQNDDCVGCIVSTNVPYRTRSGAVESWNKRAI